MTTAGNQYCIDLDNNEIQQSLSVAVSVEYETSEAVPMEEAAAEPLPTVNGGDDSLQEVLEPFSDTNENEPVESDENDPVDSGELLEPGQSGHENPGEEVVADGDVNEADAVEESLESENEKQDQDASGEEEQAAGSLSEPETNLLRKRRGRPLGRQNSLPSLKRAKTEAEGLGEISWEDLMGHIQCRLHAMDSDECFLKAVEISMLARSEVESRSKHLLNAFDMMPRGKSTSVPGPPPTLPGTNAAPTVAAVSAASRDALERWMAKYLELKQFQRLNGHCDVPFDQPSYEVLAKWTLFQKHHQSNLNSTQRHLLNSIKFQWGDETKSDKASITMASVDATAAKDEKGTSAKELKAQVNQSKAEKEFSKQKQVKMHRTTKYRTVESVPCIKMEPPLPPKCESDEASILAEVPMFSSLVNFPNARYFGNCVMCDDSEFPVPKQNKGVCNNCDTAVWVFAETGLQIKWCKGCKNFKKWLDFGAKGYSSKCQSCRSLQAQRYALTKKKGDSSSREA
ncbi:hypothetical protein HJC23_005780 [Cyclotella cryptica]|uniref:Helicase-associated domain-containing protein n=1 Tax=Cyclotella cryptica TaxID=29204 RepID=A0ABD3P7T6_9STRA|eukprot:CCRYP_016749-RA/>CCRYP_016749-RA protein AED:0.07 eAED:0.07 QI:94/1/1/1/1/1/2/675/512